MFTEKDVLVISDLHLAAERGCGLFQADAALAAFLDWVAETARGSHLVLAGDVLDYLALQPDQVDGGLFNPQTAARQTQQILDCHREVFSALARLAQSPHHRLTIMGGNHDPELALPDVQATINGALFPAGNAAAINWLVNGTAAQVQVGPAKCLIEHGDLYDDWNRIDHDAVRQMAALASRGITDQKNFKPPVGSKLVVHHLTRLRKDHQWIDLLKPERESIVPIIRETMPLREQLKLLPGLKMLEAEAGVESLVRQTRRKLNPAQLYREATPARNRFRAWLRAIDRDQTARGPVTEDRWAGIIERLRVVAEEEDFFDLAAPEAPLTEDQAFLIERGADLLIHGHTHAGKAYPVRRGVKLLIQGQG